jgi:gluconolactonase
MSRHILLYGLLTGTLCLALSVNAGVFPSGVSVITLTNGPSGAFFEGPSRDVSNNVYFTDRPHNRIYIWTDSNDLSLWWSSSGGANGTYRSKDGDLLLCQQGLTRIARVDAAKNVTVVVSQYGGNNFNSCNDIWEAPDGGIYFTDPNWPYTGGPQGGSFAYYVPPGSNGAIRLSTPGLHQPNGIIGTQDGKTLYINDDDGQKTYRYKILSDGTVTNGIVFAGNGRDGMTIDDQGNVYACTWSSSTINVYDEDGNTIDAVNVGQQCWNCTIFGQDKDKLFVTAGNPSSIYAIDLIPREVYRQGINGYAHAGSMIDQDFPNTNYGTNDLLLVGSSGGASAARAVFSFSLTNLFPGAIITNAVLKLRAVGEFGAITNLELHRLTVDFDENSVTWNNAESGVPWTGGGDFDATPLAQVSNLGALDDTPLYFSGTALVAAAQAAFNTTSDLALLVRSASTEAAGGGEVAFIGSDDNPDQSYRPMLTLDVVPEPAGGALALLLGAWALRTR